MMLQRAANNAYSWWWASHIRTKQSKWLEQNLQDMEEKVANTLKLIEEDGDSFAKRAEMYYKKRPELINFVEESYKAYRALAERYDHISTELQNANTTIASVFPDQVPFEIDEDDDDYPGRPPDRLRANIPKVPKAPVKELKSILSSTVKKLRTNKATGKKANAPVVSKSGLAKATALEKIDKGQKDILALQTVKEFVKSSYEGNLAKYCEIEKQITELQEEVSALEDEFGEGIAIEDDEARSLMAAAALKSCQETLVELRDKQRRSAGEAKEQQHRIKEVWQKFESLKKEVDPDQSSGEANQESSSNTDAVLEELCDVQQEEEMKALEEKIKEQFQVGEKATLTVSDMAEKIDELVNKVISLETAVSLQTVLIERLKTETDDLQTQIKILEDDKAAPDKEPDGMKTRIKEMEDKLRNVRDLNTSVKAQNMNLQTHFTEADCNLEHLTDKVKYVRPDDEQEIALLPNEIETKAVRASGDSVQESEASRESRVTDNTDGTGPSSSTPNSDKSTEQQQKLKGKLVTRKHNASLDEPDWREMFVHGMENWEKSLLAEYTMNLRNFKEMKRKLVEVENNKSQNGASDDTTDQLRELRNANAAKDEEIQALREKLSLLQSVISECKDAKEKIASSESFDDAAINRHYEVILIEQSREPSEVEEKLRMELDQILEENLDFWLRFSSAYNQIQKYATAVEDLRSELSKLEEKRKEEGSKSRAFSLNSDLKPIYKHLAEIKTELNGWMEKCMLLKVEQQKRFSSLCNIQEDINKALKTSAEDEEFKFTSYQAAKFQGEVLNMKQENNKVAEELQAGLDHITLLQIEVDKTLAKLNEEFGLAGPSHTQSVKLNHTVSRGKVPLRSFIFGTKTKKLRSTIFTRMTPAMHWKLIGQRQHTV